MELYLAIVLALSSLLSCTDSQAMSNAHKLQWLNVTNSIERGALCNDFSTAGYFIRSPPSSRDSRNISKAKWVIYLESGGGCTSPESCNQRFIDQTVREKYTRTLNGTQFVDVEEAWNDYHERPLEVTSKLMTSLWTFSEGLRTDGETWTIDGKGILSTDSKENPDFYDYNHVVIPYCSSDLWLKKTNNFVLANDSTFQFQFDPNANYHQFTFRGVSILRGVIDDMFDFHGLNFATEVIFAGSSAGGVGAMNHAGWLKQQLQLRANKDTNIYLLLDSAWFIDFRGSIREQFAPDDIQALVESDEILDTCRNDENDPTICLSAVHFLSHASKNLEGIPTFLLFSRYDLYLLVSSLRQVDSDILSIVRIGSEYSGSMNASLLAVATEIKSLSYFVTSCFQHVYLGTSSLWGEDGLLGTAAVDGELRNNRFEHAISSEVWSSYQIEHYNSSLMIESLTIQEAIHEWMLATKTGDVVRYQDYCGGPHCNPQCPENIILGETSPYWDIQIQGVLLAIVVLISLSCAVVKVLLSVRARYNKFHQKRFLEWNYFRQDDDTESALPYCRDTDAISVACLNLRYSVTVRKSDLKKATTPSQRRRLLSLAAADSDPVDVWRGDSREGGDSGEECGEGFERKQLDSETGQTMIQEENEFAKSIRQFQEIHSQKQKSKTLKGRIRGHHRSNNTKRGHKKEILKGISTYFNPGELVAIMGPSGCGKTTFLDLLAGRRNGRDDYQGELFVNGSPIDKVHDWYIANTGYVLQLATPYYEELTVRENITLAAQMRLSKSLSLKEKFERVEQVMSETGLHLLASTVVGGATGPGLSGGQKRRLCVALQLLNMPSLIFLDEPTSGLDASSSLELLSHLHRVASSNRAVILTIHQPRLEIFHMFDKVILLCQGQVAYHGIPEKAYEVFVEAHQTNTHSQKMEVLQSKNPADVIMDMLGSEEARSAILNFYQHSDEPQAVENAIEEGRMFQEAGTLNRLSCLEARASKRAALGQVLYLPVIFAVYGILLGTVYLQTSSSTLILSGYGVFSCASALFMFPIIYTNLYRAMEIFSLEYADGVGNSIELVLQTFIRFSSLAMLPVLFCSVTLYLLAVPYTQYDPWVFTQITVISLALNHTWIALLVFVIMAQPGFAHRISPVLSAIAGFSGGFFVPPRLMPPWYSWLFYINPNFYGFSAMARILLQDLDLGCPYESPIECFPSSGAYILTYFDLHTTNPFLNTVILLGMTFTFLALAWIALTYRHAYVIARCKKFFGKRKESETSKTNPALLDLIGPGLSSRTRPRPLDPAESLSSTSQAFISEEIELESINNQVTYHDQSGSNGDLLEEFKKVNLKASPNRLMGCSPDEEVEESMADPKEEEKGGRRFRLRNRQTFSRMLQDGETHQVWKPGAKTPKPTTPSSQSSLEERRRSLFHRINTYRSALSPSEQGIVTKPSAKKCVLSAPHRDNMQRRIAQWKKIEEEAKKQQEQCSIVDTSEVCSILTTPPTSASFTPTQPIQISQLPHTRLRINSNQTTSSLSSPSSYETTIDMATRSLPSIFQNGYGTTPPSPLLVPNATSFQSIERAQLPSQAIKSSSPNNARPSSRYLGQNSSHTGQSPSLQRSPTFTTKQPQGQFFVFPDAPSSIVELGSSLPRSNLPGSSQESLDASLPSSFSLDSSNSTGFNIVPSKAAYLDYFNSQHFNTDNPLRPTVSSNVSLPGFQVQNFTSGLPPDYPHVVPPAIELQPADNSSSACSGVPGSPHVLSLPPRGERRVSNVSVMDSILEVDSEFSSSSDNFSDAYRATPIDSLSVKGDLTPVDSNSVKEVYFSMNTVDSESSYECNDLTPCEILVTGADDDTVPIDSDLTSPGDTVDPSTVDSSTLTGKSRNLQASKAISTHESYKLQSNTNTDSDTIGQIEQPGSDRPLEFPCTLEDMGITFQQTEGDNATDKESSFISDSKTKSSSTHSPTLQTSTDIGGSDSSSQTNLGSCFSPNLSKDSSVDSNCRLTVNTHPLSQAVAKPKWLMPMALKLNRPLNPSLEKDQHGSNQSQSYRQKEIWTKQIANRKPIPVSQLPQHSPRHNNSLANINNSWNGQEDTVMASGLYSEAVYVAKSPTVSAKPNMQVTRFQTHPHTDYQQTDF